MKLVWITEEIGDIPERDCVGNELGVGVDFTESGFIIGTLGIVVRCGVDNPFGGVETNGWFEGNG